ncbi:ABC transporter substrate-binding protein [Nocardioides sp. Bht2]|uniref:taurine ABC transporter substrate-binding protein n=1 Tax=Nocardioides sp. Bht2 TaxID=3392297 RepID=UPI0039B677E0
MAHEGVLALKINPFAPDARRRRLAPVALAAALLPLALAGCVDSDREASAAVESDCPWAPDESITGEVRIAWQTIPNADVVVKDLGLLEACAPKATIKWVQAASGGDVLKYYGSGEVDLGLMGSAPATKSASEPLVDDIDIKVIWIHDVIGDAESLVVRDPGIADVTGLAGKKVAVPFSSTAHYSLLQALAEEGLQAGKDVEVINLAPEQMPAAWQGDEIDAAWVWEPAQSQLIADGGTRILSSADTAELGRPTFDVGTISTAFAAANPAFVDLWARVQDHAVKLIGTDPDAAAESIAVALGVTPDEAKAQSSGLLFLDAATQAGADYLGGKLGEDLFVTAGFLGELGEIDAVAPKVDYAAHVDAGPAQRADR